MKRGRPYMSIGEVLNALKSEFEDVSVSKIRFLESEGLLSPERTPSGYRAYYEKDLQRLRAILALQRDSFLPLKEIKKRIDDGATTPPVATATPASENGGPSETRHDPPAAQAQPEDDIVGLAPDLQLNENDLADAAGLELGQVRALAEFGVICPHGSNGNRFFDADDLAVGQIARDLLNLGIDPRHLRTLRRSAEQEAGLFEQLVTPVMRNRRPEARQQAVDTARSLATLSRRLRHAYLRQHLRGTLNGER